MRFIALALFCPVAIYAVAGCSSGSNSNSNPITNPPPVSAQTMYSNASLSGTYVIGITGDIPNTSVLGSGIGTAQFDGSGNITAMSLTDSADCTFAGTGTYSLDSNDDGSASIGLNPTSGQACETLSHTIGPFSLTLLLKASQQGASFLLVENDAAEDLSITGLKQ